MKSATMALLASVPSVMASRQGTTPMIVTVITIYIAATTAMEISTARGIVRAGSFTSPPKKQTLL